jgi:hypothetical protein
MEKPMFELILCRLLMLNELQLSIQPIAKVPNSISFSKEAAFDRFELTQKTARVHFIPNLKVVVFVTLSTPYAIKKCGRPLRDRLNSKS